MDEGARAPNENFNAQRVVAQYKASARQLEASGVLRDSQPGKLSLLELLAAARKAGDWPLYESILLPLKPGPGDPSPAVPPQHIIQP